MSRRLVPVVLLACVLLPLVRPGSPARADEEADRGARFVALEREVAARFQAKEYDAAAEACRQQIALMPEEAGPHYNLACALARLGRTEEALASLARSVGLGFLEVDHIRADPDLESLRALEGFAQVLAEAAEAERAAAARWYEPGETIAGVRTVEGDPEGGLRWRLRIAPDAGPEARQRLVVWLHPSGGSMNDVVEALAPKLVARGYALLVPSAKPWASWSEAQARRLLAVTLPDAVKTVPGLDVARPVLMGFSAGGQMALSLWAEDASRLGGLVLDAAYPIDPAAYGEGRVEALPLPPGDAWKGCPLFVLVGDQDGGHVLWKRVEEAWKAAGVPLTVTYVEGGRHAWLLGAEREAALLAWLERLRAPAPAPAEAEAR